MLDQVVDSVLSLCNISSGLRQTHSCEITIVGPGPDGPSVAPHCFSMEILGRSIRRAGRGQTGRPTTTGINLPTESKFCQTPYRYVHYR
jgi:hypothetical protein